MWFLIGRRKLRRNFGNFLFLLHLVLLFDDVISAKPENQNQNAFTVRYDGDVNIGVLVNLHHSPSIEEHNDSSQINDLGTKSDRNPSRHESACGFINIDSVQQVVAAKWAVDVINNQSLPNELKIGLQIHDTCNSEDLTQKHLYNVISTTQDLERALGIQGKGPPLLGMIGIGEPASLSETTGALHAFNIPLVSVAPDPADQSLGAKYSNVLTTAPDMAGQARALVNIAYEMNADKMSVLSSSRATIETFLSEATALGIRVPHVLEYRPHEADLPNKVEAFLRKLPGKKPLVVLISEAGEAVTIAEHLKHVQLDSEPIWLVGSLGLDLRTLTGWRKVFHGGLFVEPHMPELNEFKNYFIGALQMPDGRLQHIIEEYKEEMFGCGQQNGVSGVVGSSPLVSCGAIPLADIELRFQQDPHVSFVVKAVSALTAAFRLVQLDHCTQSLSSACLKQVHPDLHEDILHNLKKLSFNSVPGSPVEVEGTQHHFTRNGRLVANKQLVFQIDQNEGTNAIGWYSEDEGLHLNAGFQLELVERVDENSSNVETTKTDSSIIVTERTAPVSSPLVVNSDRSVFGRSIGQVNLNTANGDNNVLTEVTDEKKLPVFSYESFISRTWSLVVVAVAIFGTCVCLWMLIYVFIKMCDGTLNGNQTMGILLLLGIMCLFASVVPWLLPPNEMVCANRHFFHPLAMVLCFAILLVKAMQLRSLVSVGLGGTIPHVNQMVSLIFMLLVQVVIAIEWYISSSPLGVQINDGYPECAVSKNRFLLLHLYPCTLLLLAFFYGISVLKIKRNFNEGRWITCATVFVIPIFAAWSVVYYFAPIQYHDPSVAVSIVSVAGILLSAIFFPKMHTIARQSKLKGDELQRSHSDSTVFTAFSDYAQNFGGKSSNGGGLHDNIYPVYGNYHPHNHYISSPMQHTPAPPAYPPPPAPGGPSQYMTMHPHAARFHFNGLNYVPKPPNRSNRQPLTSYAEWTREIAPERNAVHHSVIKNQQESKRQRHDSETSAEHRTRDDNEGTTTRRRCKSLSRDQLSQQQQQQQCDDHHRHHHHHHVRHTQEEEEDAEDNYSTVMPQQRSLSSSRVQMRHSTSPSDGMILTPSGLAYPINPNTTFQSRIAVTGRGQPGLHVSGPHQHPRSQQQQQLYHPHQFHYQQQQQQPDLYLSTAT